MRLLSLAIALLATPVTAHEFWIEPLAYQVAPEGRIVGNIVNGEDFGGNRIPYLPQRFVHFVNVVDGRVVPVPGRLGDQPALAMDAPAEGLNVFAYQAKNATVDYKDWQTVQNFIKHKDLGWFYAAHSARGFPEEAFKEVYSRYSKSLVGVGNGAGSDVRTGMLTEIVALSNPYTDDVAGSGMRLQLFYQDTPRGNVQLEVFEKSPAGQVTQRFYRTDDQGRVTVPVKRGHSYMADAVVMREPSEALKAETGAIWETLWANMTWGVPG